MSLFKYTVTLKHDSGTIRISTLATSEEAAKTIVTNYENAPMGAFVKVVCNGSIY